MQDIMNERLSNKDYYQILRAFESELMKIAKNEDDINKRNIYQDVLELLFEIEHDKRSNMFLY